MRPFTKFFIVQIFIILLSHSLSSQTELKFLINTEDKYNYYSEIFTIFSRDNPDITVKIEPISSNYYQTVKQRLKQQDAPDIFESEGYQGLEEFAGNGQLLDLTYEPFMKNVYPATLKSVTHNGRYYAMPVEISGFGIIYNKSIFNKYGFRIPRTISEIKKICDILKTEKILPFAAPLKSSHILSNFFFSLFTNGINDTVKIDTWLNLVAIGKDMFPGRYVRKDDIFKTIDYYISQSSYKENITDEEIIKSFVNGETAMILIDLKDYKNLLNPYPGIRY